MTRMDKESTHRISTNSPMERHATSPRSRATAQRALMGQRQPSQCGKGTPQMMGTAFEAYDATVAGPRHKARSWTHVYVTDGAAPTDERGDWRAARVLAELSRPACAPLLRRWHAEHSLSTFPAFVVKLA